MRRFFKLFIITLILVCAASMAQAQPYLASNGEFVNLDELRVGGGTCLYSKPNLKKAVSDALELNTSL